ncbi:MAG: chromate efflux transporter [Chloroflexi bacterium]|nr:chromate efflux transporter [Chloroflexota bacterium]
MSGSFWEVLGIATKLGLTSFGGPIAHLGYFHDEYVVRRKWLDDHAYSDLVALCQFLPGPASSQVGIGLGLMRAGLPGGLAAWLGFTLPSALLLTAFAYGLQWLGPDQATEELHGLKIVAVAVVAQAVWSMARTLCPDRERASIAILAAVAVLAWPVSTTQLLVIATTALAGWRFLRATETTEAVRFSLPYGRRLATAALALFFALLIGLPVARQAFPIPAVALFDSFFRTGSLVFGGGHVVLPLLQAQVVPPGWISNGQFVAGYGAAQAVPGPLFTFAAYLGAVMQSEPNGWSGAILALVAIFLPSFLLVVGGLPYWDSLRTLPQFRSALLGVNAGVVGILLAALYDPVWSSAISRPLDFALAVVGFGLLTFWRVSPFAVVLFCAAAGYALNAA